MKSTPIQLVIFDWAGTTIDFGCFAPVMAFVKLFAERGVTVTAAQARVPMGLAKRDHIVAMLQDAAIAADWRKATGHAWTESDVDQMYHAFAPLQMAVLGDYSMLVPGLLPVIAELRRRDIKIGATTGYFRAAAHAVAHTAAQQGYTPDHCAHADDVPAGRPAPWMIHRNMEALGIYPPSAVVKVGDTVPDIEEGLAAGAWSIGVTASGSEVGLSLAELDGLSDADRSARVAKARRRLVSAGAHAVIDDLSELPAVIDRLGGISRDSSQALSAGRARTPAAV